MATASGRPIELGRAIGAIGARARDLPSAAAEREAARRPSARRAAARQPRPVPRRAARGDRGRCPTDRTIVRRALPRRARRLAGLRALAVRRSRPRALGAWRSRRASRSAASTRRRSGPTTASSCACPRPTTTPAEDTLLLDPDEIEDVADRRARLVQRCSRRASARTPRAPSCSRGAGPGSARRSGSSVSASADLLGVGKPLRIVPDPARDVPRVPARRLRLAGPAGGAAAASARGSCAW